MVVTLKAKPQTCFHCDMEVILAEDYQVQYQVRAAQSVTSSQIFLLSTLRRTFQKTKDNILLKLRETEHIIPRLPLKELQVIF